MPYPQTMQSSDSNDEITVLLQRWVQGDQDAFDRLMPEVLGELKVLANHHLSRQGKRGHTLQPTALVNEAYLKMVGTNLQDFENRRCFYAFASQLIRNILVDHARSRLSDKRGGKHEISSLELGDDVAVSTELGLDEILTIHHCLERLAAVDPRQSRIAELRYFAGLTVPEIAEVLDTSITTVERQWRLARRRLALELSQTSKADADGDD